MTKRSPLVKITKQLREPATRAVFERVVARTLAYVAKSTGVYTEGD